jgi:hypothetical protein
LRDSLREKEASALGTCVDRLDGALRAALDPLRVNAGSTQRPETAANAELTGIAETGN